MTSTDFVCAFQAGSIAPGEFHHREHLRLAYSHIAIEPLAEAIDSFKQSLGLFLDRVGEHGKYHETITVAFMLIVADRMECLQECHTWDDFQTGNPDLFNSSRSVLLEYYSSSTLSLDESRTSFVLPDLVPLPAYSRMHRATSMG